MNDLAQRIAALPPEKLALLERRLNKRLGPAGDATSPPHSGGNGARPLAEARAERAPHFPDPRQTEEVLEQHPAVRRAKLVFAEHTADKPSAVAYLVPDEEHARPVLQILRMQDAGRLSGRPRYELPNGMSVVHLNRSETEYVYREIFEEQSYLRHGVSLTPGACVFDVGAHIGLFTLFASQSSEGTQVYAFEPIPPIFDVLQLNASIYGVNAKLFEFGLGDREGTASFSYYPHASVLSGRYADAAAERQTVKACLHTQQRLGVREMALSEGEVDELLRATLTAEQFSRPVRTLSQVMRENGVGRIDLLKIDVEKSEHDVLAGIDDEDWPKIWQMVVEVHDIGGRLEQIVGLLEGRGFKLTVEQDALLKDTSLYNIYAVRPALTGASAVETGARAPSRPKWGWSSPERLVRDVRQFAAEKLPAHLRPGAFVLLHALPLTPAGEVDHTALHSHDGKQHSAQGQPAAPHTATERRLAKLWAEVLGLEQVGVGDNFFELGGDWLQATGLVSRVRQSFGVELSLRDLSEAPTVASMALVIDGRGHEPRVDGDGAADLSPNGSHEDRRLPEVDRLSDDDVNSFLTHLRTAETPTVAPPAAVTAPGQSSPEDYFSGTISRITAGEEYDLLTNLHLLSDEEVDTFLSNMFTEGEIAAAFSAINSPAATRLRDEPDGNRWPAAFSTQPGAHADSPRAEGLASGLLTGSEALKLFEQAYLTYTQTVREAGMYAQRQAEQAHFNHTWATRELLTRGGDKELFDEASHSYALALQEAHQESQASFEEAYLNYLKEIRDIWVQVDVNALAPGFLLAMSQNMATAANSIAGLLGRWYL